MNPFRFSHSRATPLLAPLMALSVLLGGCKNAFIPKHKVLVDAISAADAPKPSGLSYRLIAKRSVISQTPVQVPVVKACVDAALSGQGMFEPPANTAPDVFIEVGYGRDNSPRADPAARETFLQLSARSNPQRALDRPSGPELWDVKVSILGAGGSVENAMPLLSAVAANYLAANTRLEAKVEIPQNSPMVEAVRNSAIKALEARNPGADAPAGRTGANSSGSPTAAATSSAPGR